MEQFLIHGGVNNWDKYNCGAMPPEQWTERDGVRHELEGILTTIYGVIVELMYIPCLWVLSGRDFQVYSCFKIMYILGFIDMGAIAINSILTGIFLYEGAVYCTYPTLIYVSGSFAMWFWCTSCMLCLILVTNRLLDFVAPNLAKSIFDGNKTYLITLFPILYGLYFFFFTNTVMFQSKYRAWFFDPMIEVGKSEEYNNFPHYANNIFVVGFTVVLYAYFVIILGRKMKAQEAAGSGGNRAHKQILVQSAVICTFTFAASIIYVLFQIVPVPLWVIKLGHIMWQMDHSCPAFIYLFVNTTIRNAVLRKIGLQKINNSVYTKNSSIGPEQVASKFTQYEEQLPVAQPGQRQPAAQPGQHP